VAPIGAQAQFLRRQPQCIRVFHAGQSTASCGTPTLIGAANAAPNFVPVDLAGTRAL
jgi:hypothetical protein